MSSSSRKEWREWFWRCECGESGEAAGALWMRFPGRETVLMLCPFCNRKLSMPKPGKPAGLVDAVQVCFLRDLGLTQDAIAKAVGCTIAVIRRVLRNRKKGEG